MNNFNSLPVSGLTVSIVPPGFIGYPLLALITLPSVTVPVNSVELVELNLFCIVVGLLSAGPISSGREAPVADLPGPSWNGTAVEFLNSVLNFGNIIPLFCTPIIVPSVLL